MPVNIYNPEVTGTFNPPHSNKAAYTNLAVGSLVGGHTIVEKMTVYIVQKGTTGSPWNLSDSELAARNWTIGS